MHKGLGEFFKFLFYMTIIAFIVIFITSVYLSIKGIEIIIKTYLILMSS
jgi:hypothetical protein